MLEKITSGFAEETFSHTVELKELRLQNTPEVSSLHPGLLEMKEIRNLRMLMFPQQII